MKTGMVVIALMVMLLPAACVRGQTTAAPPEIRYGEDVCAECNMIISDVRFAAGYAHEIGDDRYESLAFDDIGDMLVHAGKHPEHQIVAWYVHDYVTKEWLDATEAHYVLSQALHTPMGFGIAACGTAESAQQTAGELNGTVVDWDGLRAQLHAGQQTQ
jgi:copper chaperone NosL